jgi:hypothetical protein
MTDHEDLKVFLEARNAAFADMTEERARAFWDAQGFPPPLSPNIPLGAMHKARLQWLDATDAMLAESLQWLDDHGFKPTFKDSPPLTPEKRDADRAALGRPPLGSAT